MNPATLLKMILGSLASATFCTAYAEKIKISSSIWYGHGDGAHGMGGALIMGYDHGKRLVTGHYETSDTTGVGTNHCKFFLHGHMPTTPGQQTIQLRSAYEHFIDEERFLPSYRASIMLESSKLVIVLQRIPSSCGWLYQGLPQYAVPESFRNSNRLQFRYAGAGDWKQIRVIQSKRAYFHTSEVGRQKNGSYVIQGDVVHIYKENLGRMFAEHHNDFGKKTLGWIEKADLMPLQ